MQKNPYYQADNTHTLVTHKHTHVDEQLALALLLNFGETRGFPGVKNAKIEFWDAGTSTPDGKPWQDWHQRGYLLIGVGGSCFDEHATATTDRKVGQCSATFVAKALKFDGEPCFEKILRYVAINDLYGGQNPYELASLIRAMNDACFDENPENTTMWGIHVLKVLLHRDINFFNKTGEEFKKCSQVFDSYHRGNKIIIAIIESDDRRMAAYARSAYGAKADVVLQFNCKGNVFISSQNKSRINFDEVIKLLRIEELKVNRSRIRLRADDLCREGSIADTECKCWYYDRQARRIMNGGGGSNTNVLPTKIPRKQIADILQFGLQRNHGNPIIKSMRKNFVR